VSAVLITGEAMVKACRFTVPVGGRPAELTMLFWCFMAQLCFASLSPQS
jgi:hypothetical protein